MSNGVVWLTQCPREVRDQPGASACELWRMTTGWLPDWATLSSNAQFIELIKIVDWRFGSLLRFQVEKVRRGSRPLRH